MAGRPTLYHRQVATATLPAGMRVHHLGMGRRSRSRRGPTLAKASSRFTRKGRPGGARVTHSGQKVPRVECPESGIICVHPWLCYECTPTA